MPDPAEVALLAEGVDRNLVRWYVLPILHVALLAEGVDRNSSRSFTTAFGRLSPSSRRAWIEIRQAAHGGRAAAVALLAEGVDRNRR